MVVEVAAVAAAAGAVAVVAAAGALGAAVPTVALGAAAAAVAGPMPAPRLAVAAAAKAVAVAAAGAVARRVARGVPRTSARASVKRLSPPPCLPLPLPTTPLPEPCLPPGTADSRHANTKWRCTKIDDNRCTSKVTPLLAEPLGYTVSYRYASDHLYLGRLPAGRGVRSWRWMISGLEARSTLPGAACSTCRRSRTT